MIRVLLEGTNCDQAGFVTEHRSGRMAYRIPHEALGVAVQVTDITGSNVFGYESEVIVELYGRTDDGEITVITYFFEPDDGDPALVKPQEPIDDDHKEAVQQALQAADYRLPG